MTVKHRSLEDWLAWLEQAHPIHEIELGLSRIKKVAARLGLLEPLVPVITVAGTNGKGSVVATLEALAKTHELQIASYTSPHLVKFNERIKLNGQSVSDDLLIDAFKVVADNQLQIELTYFEFTTLVALYIFSKQSLDLIVLEVGLGGRLDATNIIDADISVLTSISLDHTDWLGDDLTTIASEKAGVFRAGRPAIIADQNIMHYVNPALDRIKPRTFIQGMDYSFEQKANEWSFLFGKLSLTALPETDLFINNLAAALVAFSLLFETKIEHKKVQHALASIEFVGRFQKLSHHPLIIVDVAHNPDSAKLLNGKLEQLKSNGIEQVIAICGMLKDKDIQSTIGQMTVVDDWLAIDLPGPRGATSQALINLLNQTYDKETKGYNRLIDAMNDCRVKMNENTALVIFGSFVTVAMALKWWEKETMGKHEVISGR